jgi:glycosyltransferase involved in cell wall biosynthesis
MTMQDRWRVVACIPAFNEESKIAKVIVRAQRHVDRVVVVDDGSEDETALIAEKLGAQVIRHDRNLGYGGAMRTCFKAARELEADVMVTVDGDGQHDPDDIPRLVEPIRQGKADVVIGSRMLNRSPNGTPPYRNVGINLITKLSGLRSSAKVTDAQSGMRAYGPKAIASINPSELGMGASTEILGHMNLLGLNVQEIPVSVTYSGRDTSTHHPVFHGLDVLASMVKFTSIRHPLVFYGLLGIVGILISLGFSWWTLSIYLVEKRIVTNLLIISVTTGIFGVFLLFMGVLLFVLISVVREKIT